MKADDQLNILKQIPPLSNLEKRRKVVTSVLLTLSTLMSVLFFVYATLQKTEVNKQKITSLELQIALEESRAETKMAVEQAMHLQREAERQQALAAEALENCNRKK